MEINDDNYYQVQGWMLNRLEIKGNDLLVFAIIYGFSQDGKGLYSGSLQYLQKFTGSSKNTVLSSLKFLCEKGYIIRDDLVVNDVVFPRYKFNTQFARGVQKLNWGGAEIELGGGAEIAPNNKELYNKEYKKDSSFENFKFSDSEINSELEEKKKVKEKSCVKKESDGLHAKMIKGYHEWYSNRNDGVPPKIDAQSGKAMKELIAYFKTVARSKYQGINEDEIDEKVLEMFSYILSQWNNLDSFTQRQIKLSQINSNISNIIEFIKNGKNQRNNQSQPKQSAIDKAQEAMAILREQDARARAYRGD